MKAPTSILHIASTYKPAWIYGGPVVSTSKLCEAQVKCNIVLELFTTTANGPQELNVPIGKKIEVDGVPVTYYRRWIGDNIHFTPGLLIELFRSNKRFEIIHVHEWWNLVAILSVLLCKIGGRTPVLTPRGMLSPYTLQHRSKRIFHQILGRWLLRGTILHATSPQEAKEALALIPNWPHFILPNIIELPELGIYSPKTTKKDHFSMIFLSRIHPKKGLKTLFEALLSLDFSWRLQIVGEGEENYVAMLKKLTHEYGIVEQIDWLGWRNGSEKFQLLADADLFVLPSQNENFANVVLESLVVGTPVVLSDKVGLSSYVATQNFGWVYRDGADALAQALHCAKAAQAQRQHIRSAAPQLIHADFSATVLARQYIAAYEEFALHTVAK